MVIKPRGTPSFAHSPLVIPSFPAEMILGMFPGINMPPDMSRPYKAALIWLWLIAAVGQTLVAFVVAQFAEVLCAQPVERRTIEFRGSTTK